MDEQASGPIRRLSARVQLIAVLLLVALFSFGCVTSTYIMDVSQSDTGQPAIGQSWNIEFNKKVYDALREADTSGTGFDPSDLEKQGWQVTSKEDGRVVNATKETATLDALASQGWDVAEEKAGDGRIVTAKMKTGEASPFGEALKDLTITIDESNPQAPTYKYHATVEITGESSSSSGGSSSSGSGGWGDFWEAFYDANPHLRKLEKEIAEAPPPKFTFGVRLPANIQSATMNGTQAGEISGNSVMWDVPIEKPGTYTLEATASGTGEAQAPAEIGNLSVSINCAYFETYESIECSARTENAPADADLNYVWADNDKSLSTSSPSLTIERPANGVHSVSVMVVDKKNGLSSKRVAQVVQVGEVVTPAGEAWNQLPPAAQVAVNKYLTGSPSVTPPDLTKIDLGAVLGTLGMAALAGLAALGSAAPAGAPAGSPKPQPQPQPQKEPIQEAKPKVKANPCQGEIGRMQQASARARGLQTTLQQARSRMNALEIEYEEVRKLGVGGGILGLIGFATGRIGQAFSGTTTSAYNAGKLDAIRAEMNEVRSQISSLQAEFSQAMQEMDNARSALNYCNQLHPEAVNMP